MKKSIIALAVAGALTAPLAQADATLYGVAQFRLIDEDKKSLNANMAKTRLGVKGTVDNDIEGLTTGFQFEWEFSGDTAGSVSTYTWRKSNVYMKGDFGQVTFGTQNNPAAVYKTANIMGRAGDNWAPVNDRVGKAISYWSPDFGGFQFVAGFTADGATENGTAASTSTSTSTTQFVDGNNNGVLDAGEAVSTITTTAATAGSEDADMYMIGGTFNVGGLKVGATNQSTNKKGANSDTSTTSLGLGYTMGDLYVAASYSDVDNDTGVGADQEVILAAASYAFGKTKIYGEYEVRDTKGNSSDEKKVGLGLSYALGSSASVAIETYAFNNTAEANNAADQTVLQYTLSF